MNIKLNVSVKTDVGLVRQNNEDNVFIPGIPLKKMDESYWSASTEINASQAFLCVCDGMGGHNSGEVASYTAVEQTMIRYTALTDSKIANRETLETAMNEFVADTNAAILEKSESSENLQYMGTTMAGIYFLDNKAYFVNIGDSRIYALKGRKLVQLSEDHADPVMTNALTRYLGMSTDFGVVEPDVAIAPIKIADHTRFLLCSDGLTDMVDEETIEGMLLEKKSHEEILDSLIKSAKSGGGKDNITAMIIDASPANKIVKYLYNKLIACSLAAVLCIGAGATYYFARPAPPMPDSASTLESIQKDIETAKNAKSLAEKEEAHRQIINKGRKYAQGCRAYIDGFPRTDDSNVEAKRAEYSASIESLEVEVNNYSNSFDSIMSSEADDMTKMSQLDELLNSEEKIEAATAVCGEKQKALDGAWTSYKAWLEQQKATPTTTPKPTPTPKSSKQDKTPTQTPKQDKTPTPSPKQDSPVQPTNPSSAPAVSPTSNPSTGGGTPTTPAPPTQPPASSAPTQPSPGSKPFGNQNVRGTVER